MPKIGSVNQMEPSDLTTTSLGELRRWPCQVSIKTVRVPSYSVRVTRRPPCSQVIERGDGRVRVTWVRTPAGRGWKSGIHRHAKVLLRVVCFRCKRMVCTVMGCKVYVSQHTCRGIMGTPSPSRAVTAARRGARDH